MELKDPEKAHHRQNKRKQTKKKLEGCRINTVQCRKWG